MSNDRLIDLYRNEIADSYDLHYTGSTYDTNSGSISSANNVHYASNVQYYDEYGRITFTPVAQPNDVLASAPEAEEDMTIGERLIEFYQWLKEEATEIEYEDPTAARCVEVVIREMEYFFPEIVGSGSETLRYGPECDIYKHSRPYTAKYQNLVTYGGSSVERFREHG